MLGVGIYINTLEKTIDIEIGFTAYWVYEDGDEKRRRRERKKKLKMMEKWKMTLKKKMMRWKKKIKKIICPSAQRDIIN